MRLDRGAGHIRHHLRGFHPRQQLYRLNEDAVAQLQDVSVSTPPKMGEPKHCIGVLDTLASHSTCLPLRGFEWSGTICTCKTGGLESACLCLPGNPTLVELFRGSSGKKHVPSTWAGINKLVCCGGIRVGQPFTRLPNQGIRYQRGEHPSKT